MATSPPKYARLCSVLGNRRGITLMEVLISAAVLGWTIYFLTGSMRWAVRDMQNRTNKEVFEDFRYSLPRRIVDTVFMPYLFASCSGGLKSYWQTKIATSGNTATWNPPLNLALIDGSVNNRIPTLPVTTSDLSYQKFQDAAARCNAGPRGVAASTSHYLCLRFTPPIGSIAAPNELLSMQPVFGEFLFQLLDPSTGNAVSCSLAGDATNGLTAKPFVAVLNYSFYWFGTRNGSVNRVYFSPQGFSQP